MNQPITSFKDHLKERLENNVRKGENGGNQHFLLFPQCYPPVNNLILLVTFVLSFGIAFNLGWLKMFSFG